MAAVSVACGALIVSACATSLSPGIGQSAQVAQPDTAPAKSDNLRPVKIAMLLPLGGFNHTAAIAKSMKQAGEMALFERDDPRIQLVVKDDKGTPEGAKAAAEEAIREGAEIVLGPLFAQSVSAAATATRSANVPLVAFSNDRTVAGNGVYLMSFMPDDEVERIISFAGSQGKRRIAALIADDNYGRIVSQALRQTASRSGVSVVALETYGGGANGMIDPAQRVFDLIKQADAAGAPIDALFLPGGQEVLPTLGPMLGMAGLDLTRVKLLGTGAWEFPNIGRDNSYVGGWYPSPDPRGWQDFSGRFARTFGQAPPRLATLAYDAVNIAIELSQHQPGARYTAANLSRATGFRGTDGPVRFTPDGLAQRGLAVLEVQKFGSAVVDPAPASPSAAPMNRSTLPQTTSSTTTTSLFTPAPQATSPSIFD